MTDQASEKNTQVVSTGTQEPVDQRLHGALIDAPKETESLPPADYKPQKKGLPKTLIFFVVLFLFLAVILLVFIKLRDNGTFVPSGTKGEIVWWGVQHDIAVYQPLIDDFEKANPNIKIVYQKQSVQDYLERLKTALSTEKGPDIFEIHNTWPIMLRLNLSTLPASVMTKEEFSKSFYPIISSNLTLEKGVVAIPLEYDALTLYINDDVFTSALESPPVYWDEIGGSDGIAKKLTQMDGRRIIQGGAALGITENVDHWQEIIGLMLIQDGVNPAKPSGKEAVNVLSFYKQFSNFKIWDDTLPDSTTAFARGELAMYFGPTRRASEIININQNLRFRTAKLPQLRKNKPDDPNYSYATYWAQAVSEESKAKDAAWAFLKFLSQEDSLRKINQGIEKYNSFKRVYPRPEMNAEMAQDPVLGSIVYFAYDARSFYLADETYDGEDGVNTQVNNLYKEILDGNISEKNLTSKSKVLGQILAKFGIRANQ